MKKVYLFLIFILLIHLFFLPNGFTRNDTQYGLPFGVNACLGKGMINDIAFYPDGNEIAIASDSGIWKYNMHTGEESIISKDRVEILELSADGKTLASVESFWQPLGRRDPSDKVQLLDTNTLNTSSISTEHRNGINALALSQDGRTLASGGDGTIQLWDTDTGRFLSLLRGHTGKVWNLSFLADGSVLASGGADNTIRLWDTNSADQLLSISTEYTGRGFALAFSADGSVLASGSPDGLIHLWNARNGHLRSTLIGHTGGITTLIFSSDGRTLASGGLDNTIRLWNARTHHQVLTITEHTDIVHPLAFSPDGTILASASRDKTLRFWDIPNGHQLSSNYTGHWGPVTALSISPDGSTLASVSGDWDEWVYLWNMNKGHHLSTLAGHKSSGEVLVFSRDSKILACGYGDGTIHLWNVSDGRLRSIFTEHTSSDPYSITSSIDALAFSPDGRTLASLSSDKTILWDVESGHHLSTFKNKYTITGSALTFSADGVTLTSADLSETLHTFDVRTGSFLRSIYLGNIQVDKFMFSTHGTTLLGVISSQADGLNWLCNVRMWDVRTGNFLKSIPLSLLTKALPPARVVISADWTTLAGMDNSSFDTIRVWDVHTGARLSIIKSHWDSITSLALSPGGTTLVTGYSNGTIFLSDIHR